MGLQSQEKQLLADQARWEKLRSVGQTRFVTRTFLASFLLIMSTLFINELFSAAPDWRPSRIAIRFLIAFIASSAVTIIGAAGTWQDLEKQFGSGRK